MDQIEMSFTFIKEKWYIEFFVSASLLFQMILLFLAPMRKWVNNGLMYLVIWGVYLLASFFSTFALSLIYNRAQVEEIINKLEFTKFTTRITYPFWAPFLLVHQGGPHTITALAMEDNNLWHRHLLTQVVQVFSVLVVFYKYRIFQSEWLLPTAIVFLIGIAKCVERIFSLYLASSNFLRKSIRLQDSPHRPPAAASAADDNINSLDEYEIIRRGYEFYQTFKGFIIDHTFIHDECGTMKEWFRKLSEKDAFKVMESELNFMYQAMFTKMIAVQYLEKNFFWCIWWFGSHALLVTAAVIFFNQRNNAQQYLRYVDIGITYCLLGGAILIEEIALIHLIFGHWTIFKIMNSDCYKNNNNKVVKNTILPLINCGMKLISQKKSWSGKVIQYSLVKHSLTGQRWKWAELFSLKELIDSLLHTQTAEVGDRLKKLVVDNIKRKAAVDNNNSQDHMDAVMAIILPLFKDHDDDYATFVLTLHVATDICYFATGKREGDDDEEEEEDAKLCIQISHYLAYFLVLEGEITSALPGSIGMRFRDVCRKQVRDTFDHLYSTFNAAAPRTGTRTGGIWCWKRTSRQKACEDLLISDEYCEMIGSRYENSVLPKAVDLAREMKRRCSADPEAGKQFWGGLSEVWVGLLVYASSHCRGDVYYLNKGGQFCTFVRLLMAHFGLQDSLKGQRSFNLYNLIHSHGDSMVQQTWF